LSPFYSLTSNFYTPISDFTFVIALEATGLNSPQPSVNRREEQTAEQTEQVFTDFSSLWEGI